MSAFDAALDLLHGAAIAIRGHAKNRDKALQDCVEIVAACMVLEAAGKVDKGMCHSYLSMWISLAHEKMVEDGDTECHDGNPCRNSQSQLFALLSALPDDGGKE